MIQIVKIVELQVFNVFRETTNIRSCRNSLQRTVVVVEEGS